MAEGRKEGGILALTNLYDIRLCSCILLYVYRRRNRVFCPRAEFRIKKDEKKNRSSVCPFVDFAFYQKRKQRNSTVYVHAHIRIVSDRSEKKRDSFRRYSISNAQEKFMLSPYHPCVIRKRKLVGNILIYRVRYRTWKREREN